MCVGDVAARSVWAPGEGEASEADIAVQRSDPETSRCRESPLSSGALGGVKGRGAALLPAGGGWCFLSVLGDAFRVVQCKTSLWIALPGKPEVISYGKMLSREDSTLRALPQP